MLDDRQIHLTLLAPCSCFCQCRANVQDKSTNRQQAEGAIYDESCNANANSLSQAAASWATLEETDSQKARPAREASLVRLVTSAVAPRSQGSADPELARRKIANLDTIHRAHGPQGPDSLAELAQANVAHIEFFQQLPSGLQEAEQARRQLVAEGFQE